MVLILIQLFLPSIAAKSEGIKFASELHQEMCAPQSDSTGEWNQTENKCCGFCSNDPDCVIYGTCCLGMHESFEDGKLSFQSTS